MQEIWLLCKIAGKVGNKRDEWLDGEMKEINLSPFNCRWRGSIYKLVWMDLLLFLALYYGINLIYIYLLDKDSQK